MNHLNSLLGSGNQTIRNTLSYYSGSVRRLPRNTVEGLATLCSGAVLNDSEIHLENMDKVNKRLDTVKEIYNPLSKCLSESSRKIEDLSKNLKGSSDEITMYLGESSINLAKLVTKLEELERRTSKLNEKLKQGKQCI